MNRLLNIEKHIGFWIAALVMSSLSMIGALYFQYFLDWDPCVLCIQIRVIMAAIILLSILMLFCHRFSLPRFLGYGLQTALAIWLFIKSRAIFRIETGVDQAECMFNAGLPEWFNLEAWWPSVFEVRSACGDSPELFAGITMVEALYYASAFAMVITLCFLVLSLINTVKSRIR